MVSYAAYAAEKEILGDVSVGCLGSDHSDIEKANGYIRDYIILTDNDISLTGYEFKDIREKTIQLSKELLKETTKILTTNRDKLMEKIDSMTMNEENQSG
jgi:hypothetical protein